LKNAKQSPVAAEGLESLIFPIRGQRVMLDADLARIYGVTTKQLNQQLKRNTSRFPTDFAFQLTAEEYVAIRSQNVTTSRRPLSSVPWVFTEHGAIMLASVLSSPVAVEASIRVVRAFVHLRQALASNSEFARKLKQIEKKLEGHDAAIIELFATLKQLFDGPDEAEGPKREIGFHVKNARNGKEVKAVGI
jgi:hypothetical protein